MINMKFIPALCKEQQTTDDSGQVTVTPAMFSGSITLKIPTYDERCEYLEQCGIDVGDDGGVERKKSNLSILRAMVRASQKFYVEVDITKVDGGHTYKNFDDLSLDPDCDGILMEVAREVRGGFRPSKNS
jgi:hypothetical protein